MQRSQSACYARADAHAASPKFDTEQSTRKMIRFVLTRWLERVALNKDAGHASHKVRFHLPNVAVADVFHVPRGTRNVTFVDEPMRAALALKFPQFVGAVFPNRRPMDEFDALVDNGPRKRQRSFGQGREGRCQGVRPGRQDVPGGPPAAAGDVRPRQPLAPGGGGRPDSVKLLARTSPNL